MAASNLHVLILGFIGLILWMLLLISLIINFYFKKEANLMISKSIRIASMLYVVSALVTWIIWVIYASTLHGGLYLFHNVDSMQEYAYISLVLVSGFYICAFYIFILLRLKLTFNGSAYEVKNAYIRVIASILILNLIIYYSVITYALMIFYTDYNKYLSLYPIVTYTYYQFVVVDAVMRLCIMSIFNKNLLKIIANQNYINQNDKNDLSHTEDLLLNPVTKHSILVCVLITLNLIHVSLEFAVENTNIIYVYSLFIYIVIEVLCIYLGYPFSSQYYYCVCKYEHNLCQFCCRKMVQSKGSELPMNTQSTKHSMHVEEESVSRSEHEEYEMKKEETELQTNACTDKDEPVQQRNGEMDHEIDLLHTIGSLVVGIDSDNGMKSDSFDIEQIIDQETI